MKYDIILCGVGGQGVLSLSAIIASGAMKQGLFVKQSEVHGMAQRGGAVLANLRLSDKEIASDLIPKGRAAMILSMEPLESLRYIDYLSPEGTLITSTSMFKNIPDYPDEQELLDRVARIPHAVLVESDRLAREAGSARAANMVMVGAASHKLPVSVDSMEHYIKTVFARKGEKVVETNLHAFHLGRTTYSGERQIQK